MMPTVPSHQQESYYVNVSDVHRPHDPHHHQNSGSLDNHGVTRRHRNSQDTDDAQEDGSSSNNSLHELVQVVKESSSSRETLHYKLGDVITVLDKKPEADIEESLSHVIHSNGNNNTTSSSSSQNLWKGRLQSTGEIGLFDPSNTAIFLGHTLPTPASIPLPPSAAVSVDNGVPLSRQNSTTSTNSSNINIGNRRHSSNSNGHHHYGHFHSSNSGPSSLSSSAAAAMAAAASNSNNFIRGIIDVISHGASGISKRSTSSKIKRDMISMPQADFKHTGHVGVDGTFFGDVSQFFGTKDGNGIQSNQQQHPTSTSSVVTTTYGTSDANTSSNNSHHLRRNSDLSSDRQSSTSTSTKTKPKISLPMPGMINLSDLKLLRKSSHHHHHHNTHDSHHHHVDVQQPKPPSPLDSPAFESIDFGPSLMDEVFKELDGVIKPDMSTEVSDHQQVVNDNSSNVKNEIKEMIIGHNKGHTSAGITGGAHNTNTSGRKNKHKKDSVKTISPEEEQTLDSAIAMAKELATRSILDMDGMASSDPDQSPRTPTSPNKKSTKFTFPKLGRSSPKGERRTFSEEAEKIPGVESIITDEAKEAYHSLIETKKPSTEGYPRVNPVPVPIRSSSIPKDELDAYYQQQKQPQSAPIGQQTSPPEENPLRMLRSGQAPTAFSKVKRAGSSGGNSRPGAPRLGHVASSVSRSTLGTPPPIPISAASSSVSGSATLAEANNALPLPPKSLASSMAMKVPLKHHQRKHPLLIPQRSLEEETTSSFGSVSCTPSNVQMTLPAPSLSTFRPLHLPTHPLLKQVSCPEPPASFVNKAFVIPTNTSNGNNNGYVNHPIASASHHGKPVLIPPPAKFSALSNLATPPANSVA